MRSKATDANNMCEKRNGKKDAYRRKKKNTSNRYMQGVIKDDGQRTKACGIKSITDESFGYHSEIRDRTASDFPNTTK
jgi:hypothetical protein